MTTELEDLIRSKYDLDDSIVNQQFTDNLVLTVTSLSDAELLQTLRYSIGVLAIRLCGKASSMEGKIHNTRRIVELLLESMEA